MTFDPESDVRGGHRLTSREDHSTRAGRMKRPEWEVVCSDGKVRGCSRFYTQAAAEVFATYRMNHPGAILGCKQNGCPGGSHVVRRKGGEA